MFKFGLNKNKNNALFIIVISALKPYFPSIPYIFLSLKLSLSDECLKHSHNTAILEFLVLCKFAFLILSYVILYCQDYIIFEFLILLFLVISF